MAIRKLVILVAGHAIGGDPGAIGQGVKEADETVQIVDRAYNLLAPHPNIIVVVVPHNLDYVASTNWINANYKNLDDGIIVEVHKNSASVVAHGIETFTGIGPDASTARLAGLVNGNIVNQTGLPNRGVKQGAFYLITDSNQRAVLTECGFINGDPVNDDYDAKYARGIANGVCDFFGEVRPGTPVDNSAALAAEAAAKAQAAEAARLAAVAQAAEAARIEAARLAAIQTAKVEAARLKAIADAQAALDVIASSTPVIAKDSPLDVENNTLLKTILALLQGLISKITNVFK